MTDKNLFLAKYGGAKHLDTTLKDDNSYVRATAARNPNATKEHLDIALKDDDSYVQISS